MVGQELGVSDWCAIDQSMIDAFADLTDDHQLIHVNPSAAQLTPFGGAIAYGFLVLSLLSALSYATIPMIEGTKMVVNYCFDRIRFVNRVRAGARVRGLFTLTSFEPLPDGRIRIGYEVTVGIENKAKPAARAAWISMVRISYPFCIKDAPYRHDRQA